MSPSDSDSSDEDHDNEFNITPQKVNETSHYSKTDFEALRQDISDFKRESGTQLENLRGK